MVITVTDTGVGIAEEDLPFVFEDFFRGRTGRATAAGSGLGLAISRRIVEAHDGTIAVESELGQGSTFRIDLPALVDETPLAPMPEAGVAGASLGRE